ncbi:MAG: hypothetical protein HS105_06000 [Chloracidobacterium sp.]|nr:hypothetical protein [Chloracidobacterium sp.]MCO5334807.1 hypothetical protein [Pyrinomonadaceae bacterium]
MADLRKTTAPTVFEQIKRTDESGNEFWSARDLAKVLEYGEYRNFKPVIEKAKEACLNSGQPVENHFVVFHEMIDIGKGGKRGFDDGVKLSQKSHENGAIKIRTRQLELLQRLPGIILFE